ncbi:MAG TPA: hypothetical protein LFW21_00855 [Rickettsia endosymbiont of Pyrocoelia pectoralis]|nr:hypothetical protein [Rickettsia endosymbiont of Pyrocoelia pectoralis]
MLNALTKAASSYFNSPETDRKNQENENQEPTQQQPAKNIDEYLTRYFNQRFTKLEKPNLAPEEKQNILSELSNIHLYKIIPGNFFASEKSTTDTIEWLSNNIKSQLDQTLKKTKPNSDLKKFLSISILKLSNFTFTDQNVQKLANLLRNNETIKEVYLDNCEIDDRKIKILVDIFRDNKTITKISLLDNKITKIGIQYLLKVKEYNTKLTELKLGEKDYSGLGLRSDPKNEINILDNNSISAYSNKISIKSVTSEITNINLQPQNQIQYSQANEILNLIIKNHNEITGRGDIKKMLVLLGLISEGKSTLACFLSGQNLEQAEGRTLQAISPEYNAKIGQEVRYRTVNNFLSTEQDLIIMEAPGISNKSVNIIQRISDSYAYWQMFKLAEEVRIGVVVRDNSRQSDINDIIAPLANLFKNASNDLTPKIRGELQDALFYISSVAEYKTEEERKEKIDEVRMQLNNLYNKIMTEPNTSSNTQAAQIASPEEKKFIIEQLKKSINLFRKPSSDTKSFLEMLNDKDFFVVLHAIVLLSNTIEYNQIEKERENIFSYIETILQSKIEEEKNANIALIEQQKNNILDILKGKIPPNSDFDFNHSVVQANKNFIIVHLKSQLQNILTEKNLEPNVSKYIEKMINLCTRHFSDTLNIKDLSQGKWAKVKEEYKKPYVAEDTLTLAQNLNTLIDQNLETLGKIIINFFKTNKHFITTPFDPLDLGRELYSKMFQTYYNVVEDYIPAKILYKSSVTEPEKKCFSVLKQIEELTVAYNDHKDLPFNTIQKFLEIIRNFYGTTYEDQAEFHQLLKADQAEFRELLGNYIYFLNLHKEASSFCQTLHYLVASSSPLNSVMLEAKKTLIDQNLLDKAILNIKLIPYKDSGDMEVNESKIGYYKEAIDWLQKFTGKDNNSVLTVNEMKANAHYYLGMIYDSNGCLAGDMPRSHWLLAIEKYIEALKIEAREITVTKNKDEYIINKYCNFNYWDKVVNFGSIAVKVGDLLLKLGQFYSGRNEDIKAIKLIMEAIKYFKIGVKISSIIECESKLTELSYRQSSDVKDKVNTDLHKILGEYLLKMDFPTLAAFNFLNASGTAISLDNKKDLLGNAIKAIQTNMEDNAAFLISMYTSGKLEDLSMFKNKDLGIAYLIESLKKINEIANSGNDLQYEDSYEMNPPGSNQREQTKNQQELQNNEQNHANALGLGFHVMDNDHQEVPNIGEGFDPDNYTL